jgi:hypothetical protein
MSVANKAKQICQANKYELELIFEKKTYLVGEFNRIVCHGGTCIDVFKMLL